jgi:predicted type IV restriction endonuclease
MGIKDTDRLVEIIRDTVQKVQRFKDRALGEQNTKASLIEPVLEALGWDVRDPDEVHREFKPTPRDCPVDYALKLFRKPRLFVEAKGLGEGLEDRKWITQVLSYAVVAGVEWCVLTDGDAYRFYNAVAALDADEKLFCKIRLSEGDSAGAAKTLSLISRANMEENLLDVLWSAHFVDRRVKEALRGMITSADRALVRLLRRKTAKLSPKDIIDSLRRLDIRIDSPDVAVVPATSRTIRLRQATPAMGATPATPAPAGGGRRGGVKKSRADFGVRLADVIGAGILSPPVKLFRKYKGRQLEATLLPDGGVEFQGTRYRTSSTAAEVARGTITGRKMNTNGWSFWQYVGGDGQARELIAARNEFLSSKPKMKQPGESR